MIEFLLPPGFDFEGVGGCGKEIDNWGRTTSGRDGSS